MSSYFVSIWVQSLPYTRSVRGVIGLAVSLVFLLILSYLHTGPGPGSLSELIDGDTRTAVALTISVLFMVSLWWRGATIAYDEITLENLRGSFRWGLVALFVAVVAHAVSDQDIVNPYLAVGFFAVGLAGLSLARFSSAISETQEMAAGWWMPIGVSVGGVILLALLIGALGMGGLDDLTGTTMRSIGEVGLWVLKPVLLVLGGLASVLVSLANMISGWFGGGDLSSLELAQQRLSDFHEQLENARTDDGPPNYLLGALKGLAFALLVGLAAYILYRVFRFRRHLRRPNQVEETRDPYSAGAEPTGISATCWRAGGTVSLRSAVEEERNHLSQPTPGSFITGSWTLPKNWAGPDGRGRRPSSIRAQCGRCYPETPWPE